MLFFWLGPNQEKLGSGYLTHQAQNYNGEIGLHIKSNFNRLYLDFPTLQVFCDLIENFLPSLNFFLCFTFFPIASNVRRSTQNVPRGNKSRLHNIHFTISLSDRVHTFLAQFLSMATCVCRITREKVAKSKVHHDVKAWEKSEILIIFVYASDNTDQSSVPECLC